MDEFVELINSAVEEGAEILKSKKVTREEEAEWLGSLLAKVEKGERFVICAEIEGRVVGLCELERRSGVRSHTATVGIIIKRPYRDLGLGTRMLRTMIDQARSMGLKVLTLGMFATNARARHVYEKVGFREVGCVPKEFYRDGDYVDHVMMAMEL